MANYCIGDVHGCYYTLRALLNTIDFSPSRDNLYFLGDLVNRGEDSLAVLRLLHSFGDSAKSVLGNHDLHLLAISCGIKDVANYPTLANIFAAPEQQSLLYWLRQQPLARLEYNILMVHAGVLPQWETTDVLTYANEVQSMLQSNDYPKLLANMYGNQPINWHKSLQGWDRLRVIINALTRIRYCDKDGNMDFKQNCTPNKNKLDKLIPWFDLAERKTSKQIIAFGHWSTLGWQKNRQDIYALDSGCVWGGMLSAIKVDQQGKIIELIQIKNTTSAR